MAEFCKGFVYERDVSAPLTIEGITVKRFKASNRRVSGQLPTGRMIRADSVSEFVELYLRGTRAFKRREAARALHLKHLHKGRKAWSNWRRTHPDILPMLADVASSDLERRSLSGYDFSYANLSGAQLQGVYLRDANFHQAILAGADLTDAHLEGANFCRTDLYETNFTRARLNGANLQGVQLAKTILAGADLRDCKVYGMSTWDLVLSDDTRQENLLIRYRPVGSDTSKEEEVTVDGLDLAAFMYFTLNNRNLSRIIEGANRKWVLILGRFTEGRRVLDAVARALITAVTSAFRPAPCPLSGSTRPC
jgi:uncharacterized protein YjbI with pentapeptide repeats